MKLQEKKRGVKIGDTKIPCTLCVNDIQCTNVTYKEAQEMLGVISDTANKYKTKFGINKTNHVIIDKVPCTDRN